jgi:hypothetical protein
MTSLQDRLKNLRPYVVGIRFVKDMPVVDVNIKDGWKILSSDKISINKSEKTKNYLMFYSENPSMEIDEILDFVESCIDYNREIEAKEILFKTYISTLKNIFESTPYEDLKNLEFKLPKKIEEKEEQI